VAGRGDGLGAAAVFRDHLMSGKRCVWACVGYAASWLMLRWWGGAGFALSAGRRGSRWSGLRVAQTSLRCSRAGRAAELASRFALRSNSCGEHEDEARRARPPAPLRFSPLQRSPHRPALNAKPEPLLAVMGVLIARVAVRWCANKSCAGALRPDGASEAPSSAACRSSARSAPRKLTRCGCLSGARQARAASSAARPVCEQRRAVAAGDRFSEAGGPQGTGV
jgi:hypothetical protein